MSTKAIYRPCVILYGTDRPSGERKPWFLVGSSAWSVTRICASIAKHPEVLELTDCVWIVPSSFDPDAG